MSSQRLVKGASRASRVAGVLVRKIHPRRVAAQRAALQRVAVWLPGADFKSVRHHVEGGENAASLLRRPPVRSYAASGRARDATIEFVLVGQPVDEHLRRSDETSEGARRCAAARQ